MHLLPKTESLLERRRQNVFLILAGLFLGTMAMLNILGLTRFLDLSFSLFGTTVPVYVAVGVLPYPVTFLCTDLISEFYGKRRANTVVWMGMALNIWVVGVLWLGGILPGVEASEDDVFMQVRSLAFAAVFASMFAYICAQFVDVQLYHFWRNFTGGKHLWLRNNGSTVISQLIDTVFVVTITYMVGGLPIAKDQDVLPQLMVYVASGYGYKLIVALADTAPLYVSVYYLKKYLLPDTTPV